MVSPDRRVRITEAPDGNDEQRTFALNLSYGFMSTTLTAGVYSILEFEVAARHRRQGYGRLLAREALFHARSQYAHALVAPIVSREEYDVFSKVYGEQYLITQHLGSYALEGEDISYQDPTRATLYMRLDLSPARNLRVIS